MFLKQCVWWMLHGELPTPTTTPDARSSVGPPGFASDNEFFIRRNADATSHATQPVDGNSDQSILSFDWNSTYRIVLDLVPNSHISARLASKVLFAGKAVKLLRCAHGNAGHSSDGSGGVVNQDVYSYLTTNVSWLSDPHANRKQQGSQEAMEIESVAAPSSPTERVSVADPLFLGLQHHANSCGYSLEEMNRFGALFQEILSLTLSNASAPTATFRFSDFDKSLEMFTSLIEDISNTTSRKLWELLRDQFHFMSFVHGMRNTYLLGRGEMFQAISDEILPLTGSGSLSTAASGVIKEALDSSTAANTLLNHTVLPNVARLLMLEEGDFSQLLQLYVSRNQVVLTAIRSDRAANNSNCCNLHSAEAGRDVWLSGLAASATAHTAVLLVDASAANADSRQAQLSHQLWSTSIRQSTVLRGGAAGGKGGSSSSRDVLSGQVYGQGALWLPDPKYITKGFALSIIVSVDWGELHHRVGLFGISHTGTGLLLGAVNGMVNGNKTSYYTIPHGPMATGVADSTSVGMAVYGMCHI